MRVILLILILAVLALIAAFATGLISISQTRGLRAPEVATDNGVAVTGGQSPTFDIETGSVAVGTRETNVILPRVRLEPGTATVDVPTVEVRRPETNNLAGERP